MGGVLRVSLRAGLVSRIGVLLLMCGAVVSPAHAARKLHVVICADVDDARLGKHAKTDGANIKTLFESYVNAGELSITEIEPAQLTQVGVVNTLHRLTADNDDAVVFYYSGHGVFTASGAHYLAMKAGKQLVGRAEILSEIQKKKVGLTVLLTDACFNFKNITPPPSVYGTRRGEATDPLFKKLFFEFDGIVDVNAAQKNQVAGTYPDFQRGSIFTSAIVGVMKTNARVSSLGWNEVLDQVDKTARAEFRRLYPDGEDFENQSGDIVHQSEQKLTKLRMELRPISTRPNPPPPSPELSPLFDVEIDPRTGLATHYIIQRELDPRTNLPREKERKVQRTEQAELVTASDGTEYYRVRGTSSSSGTFDGSAYTYVKRTRTTPPVPVPGAQTARSERLGVTLEQSRTGVRVSKVDADGPGSRTQSGGRARPLNVGDILIGINGTEIDSLLTVANAIRTSPTQVVMTVNQAGMLRELRTNLAPIGGGGGGGGGGGPVAEATLVPRLGVSVRKHASGVEVVRVQADSIGLELGLEVGFVITQLGQQAIPSAAAFNQSVNAATRLQLRALDRDGDPATFVYNFPRPDNLPGPIPEPKPAVANARLGVTVRDHADGVEVTRVSANSIAARLQMQVGMVISRLNDRPIRSAAAFSEQVNASDSAKLVAFRDNVRYEFSADFAGPPPPPGPMPDDGNRPRLGVAGRYVRGGFRVDEVAPGSPAERLVSRGGQQFSLEPGDVITKVDNQAITSEDAFHQALVDAGGQVQLEVQSRDGRSMTLTARLSGKERVPPPGPGPGPLPPPEVDLTSLIGKYQRDPITDDWHRGELKAGANGNLTWTNGAGVSWNLKPDLVQGVLRTGDDNPYQQDNIRDFTILKRNGKVTGFRFGEDTFRRTGN